MRVREADPLEARDERVHDLQASPVTVGRFLFWLLTREIATTRDLERAKRSPFMWGQFPGDELLGVYRLRVLGLVNGPWMRGRYLAISTDDDGTRTLVLL